ncbi:5-methylcytosine-specific restriction endonuclease system specificity protein McrC [Avibacterium avium]|uniref:5-methylcytosine-specific restriction endonuclease system specificity protein McrC n=1 Tax=Avibacterium avium TaxID=751 RepID=UPI003BF88003
MNEIEINLTEEIGHINKIPVRNLWLLMLYASDLFRSLAKKNIAVEDNPDDIPDLIAKILCRQVERRIQRNLSYGYQSRSDILHRVRGRIDLFYTERHQLLNRGKVACQFDELTVNTVLNRYARAALEKIAGIVKDKKTLAYKCRSLSASLKHMGVVGECPSRSEISSIRLGRHEVEDKPMMAAAQLAFNLALPTEMVGSKSLFSPERKIEWIRKLYEKGVAGFYDVALSPKGWRVTAGKQLNWQISNKTSGIDDIFPSMRADIILEHQELKWRIIIDTKFNTLTTGGWHRKQSLRNAYLYQIYTYIRSQENQNDPLSQNASGLLLHPSVDGDRNESVTIQNHQFQFATVDLSKSAKEIRKQLLDIIETN